MHIDRLLAEAQRCHQRGQLDQARKRYERILALNPQHNVARLYLAIVLQQSGQIRTALEQAHQAMHDNTQADAAMWVNYGIILKQAGCLSEAEAAYAEALQRDPNLLAIKANLSTLYLMTGKLEQAEALCLELTEQLEEAAPWLNLARIALLRKEAERLHECLMRAEDIHPKHPDIPLLRARALILELDYAAAFDQLRQVLALQPAQAEAWALLQKLDADVVDLDSLEQAALDLANTGVQQLNLLTQVVGLCRAHLLWEPLEQLEALTREALEVPPDRAPGTAACFTLLGAAVSQHAHRLAAEATWRELTARTVPLPPSAQPRQARALRVGFLSADLRAHAVGYNLVGWFEALAHGDIEWYAYVNSFGEETPVRQRIRASMDRFINIAPLSDQETAERIRQDEIDILIDLNMMTRDTRVLVMAYRPAPIQITAVGMPGTMGSAGHIDYILVRPTLVDGLNEDGFSEQLLEADVVAHDPVRPDFSLARERADHQLPPEVPVLCCFNQHYKLSPSTFARWCEILQQAGTAVLWLVKPPLESQEQRLRAKLEEAGIDPQRLIFAPHMPWKQHVARLVHADLILDTLPYGAHTTCADGLRAGVPVITLVGNTWAGRVGRFYLQRCGLGEWVTTDPADYVKGAVIHAKRSRAEIDAIKQEVFQRYWSSPLVDTKGAAQRFAQLCLSLWQHHASGKVPERLRQRPDGTLEPWSLGNQKATPPQPRSVE